MTATRLVTTTAVGLLSVISASCATPRARDLDEVLASTVSAPGRSPYRLAVAPVAVAASARVTDEDAQRSPVPVDTNRVHAGALKAIESSGIFGDPVVLSLDRDTRSALDGSNAGATASTGSTSSLLAEAFRRRADLLLELTIREHAISFEGWHSNHVRFWEMALDFSFAFPQWWIANELYRGDVEVEARLLSVGSGEPIWTRVYRASGVDPVRLAPFDRGITWIWLDSFVVPGALDVENYVLAGRRALPHFWNDILSDLAADLARGSFLADESRLSKVLVLAVGVGQQESSVPDLDVPNKDAQRIGNAFRELGAVPPDHVVELSGSRATKAGFRMALDELASRLNPGDSLVIYFAGYGFARSGSAFLVPYDFDPENVESTTISLDEIASALEGSSGRHAIILDTSFKGDGAGTRTLPPAFRSSVANDHGELSATIARLASGRTVLLAARPDEAVARQSFDPEDKSGFFTARFLRAARMQELDANGDGWLDVIEIFDGARRDTAQLSSFVGRAQHPTRFGEHAVIPVSRLKDFRP